MYLSCLQFLNLKFGMHCFKTPFEIYVPFLRTTGDYHFGQVHSAQKSILDVVDIEIVFVKVIESEK